jgi:hypothetical protein
LLGLGTFFFSSPLVHNSGSAIVDTIGSSNRVDNLGLLGPEGGLACIAGIPDLSVVPDLPYSISIHDIGLGGVLVSPAFRRRATGFGSNGDRVDGAGTGREDQTDRGRTNYVGSNSEGTGTSGRGACPRQNSCQSAKLIRVSRANSDIPIPPAPSLSLLVVFHYLGRPHMRLIWITSGVPQSLTLPQQIPALILFDINFG